MIRILNVISNLNRAGTEQCVLNYYTHMDHALFHYDFLVLSLANGEYEAYVKSLGCSIFKISGIKSNPIKGLWNIYKFYSRHKYDIVEVHTPSPLRVAHCLFARTFTTRHVIMHAHNTSDKPKTILHRICSCLVNLVCERKFACSAAAGDYVFSNKDYQLIYNAVDTNVYKFSLSTRAAKRKELNIEDKYCIVNIGRLERQKNHEFLLKVMEEICKQDKNVMLLLIGQGSLAEHLKRQSAVLGISDNVMLLGERSDVAALLSAADVMAMPSLYEGLPVVAVEAQATYLPCVFSDAVTREVKITEDVEFISIRDDADTVHKWVDAVLKYKNIDCISRNQKLEDSMYDIGAAAQRLSQIYCAISTKRPYDKRRV